ncbi:MAG: hypothetical protein MUF58_13470 [Arcicella sp.]|jgi:hypothetical protein|nr:hypothetical protein [Arcicella sp.]
MQNTLLILLAFGLLTTLVVWFSPRNLLFDNSITRSILVGFKYVLSLLTYNNKSPTITHLSVKSLEKRGDSFLIYPDDYFEISWQVAHAYSITLEGFGNVTGLASVRCTADFEISQTFTLRAIGHGSEVSQSLVVCINQPAKIPTKLESNTKSVEVAVCDATPTRLNAVLPSVAVPSSGVNLVDTTLPTAKVSNLATVRLSHQAIFTDDFLIEIQ